MNVKLPTERDLEKMIIEEEKIRMSKEYQKICTSVKHIPNGWLIETDKMQQELVKRHGFSDEISCDIAVNKLRRARYIYPDNPIFKSPVYVRENKANKGTMNDGDEVPNISIFSVDKCETKLHDLLKTDKLNILIGASAT
jgi:hypothetical protein